MRRCSKGLKCKRDKKKTACLLTFNDAHLDWCRAVYKVPSRIYGCSLIRGEPNCANRQRYREYVGLWYPAALTLGCRSSGSHD